MGIRWAPNLRSPLAFVPPEKLFASENNNTPIEGDASIPLPRLQRRPAPDEPKWKIPRSEWPVILYRIDQGESLRQIAREYGVSYEAVRRVIQAARKQVRGLLK